MRPGVLFLLLACGLGAQDSGRATIVVKAGRVWVSPATVREQTALIVRDGMLVSVDAASKGAWPAGAEVLDFPHAVVTAGLVLADWAPAAGAADPREAVMPHARGLDLLDPFQPRPDLSRAGITVVNLSPGAERLVSGQCSAVRIGAPAEDFVLRAAGSLRVNVGEGPRSTPDLFRPPILPGPDDPLTAAEPQAPKSRAGAIAELRALLQAASEVRSAPPAAPAFDAVDLRPFVAVLNGALPLRVAADRQADVARAIDLAREFHVKLVIEGGNEAWMLADELKEVGAAVILRHTSLPPVGAGADVPLFRPEGEGSPDAAAVLQRAGVPVALTPPSHAEAKNFMFHAARALGPGFTWSDVLSAVTLGAARILGVDADVGTIATGRRADFVVWSTDPLEPAARPLLVVAGGRIATRVKLRDDLVAITVKRVHTCAGDSIPDATVVVEGGRIRSVGQRVTIPHDARRVIDRDAVLVPGFIDGGSQLGLRGYSIAGEEAIVPANPVGALGMDVSIASAFDPGLPAVRAAARAGVTAVALSPGAGRLPSGSIAVVKTGGPAKDAVAKRVGGVLFDLSGLPAGEPGRKQLDAMLEAGKKYSDSFIEYEKQLDAWKRGVKVPAPVREKLDAPKAPLAPDPVTGTWTGTASGAPFPEPQAFTLELKLVGTTVSGTVTGIGRGGRDITIEGTFESGVLRMRTTEGRSRLEFELTIGRDTLSGTLRLGASLEFRVEASRTTKPAQTTESRPAEEKKDAAKAAVPDDGRPKPPREQPGLEPYRELFADRASAFLICPDERSADLAIEVFRKKYELRCVMIATNEIVEMAPRFGAAGVALAPTAASIREEEGVLINPALIAFQNKVPVLFRSGWNGDARSLYAIAEAAVRDGVDPEDALRMITRQTARFVGMLDRLGSIERGKDADLVLLTGEPFAPGTRVKRVMVGGEFLDEEDKP